MHPADKTEICQKNYEVPAESKNPTTIFLPKKYAFCLNCLPSKKRLRCLQIRDCIWPEALLFVQKIYQGRGKPPGYEKHISRQILNQKNNSLEDWIRKNLGNRSIYAKSQDGKWGFVDQSGNVVVDYIYDKATDLNSYGYAGIEQDGKWGVVDAEGKVIVEPTYVFNVKTEPEFIKEYYKVVYGYGEFYYTK